MKERSQYFNEQRGTKRKGDNRGTFQMQEQNRRPAGDSTQVVSIEGASIPTHNPR